MTTPLEHVDRELSILTTFTSKRLDKKKKPKPTGFFVFEDSLAVEWEYEKPKGDAKWNYFFSNRYEWCLVKYNEKASFETIEQYANKYFEECKAEAENNL